MKYPAIFAGKYVGMQILDIFGSLVILPMKMLRIPFIVLTLILLCNSCSYLPDENGVVLHLREENGDYAVYYSSEMAPRNAFLIIPGGLVDPYVYECWIDRLAGAQPNVAIVLVKFPSNLAITHMGKLMKIAKDLDHFDHWVVGGHSLGGVVSTTVVNKNKDFFDGAVMLASWSRENTDLSNWQGIVLSIYASEDLIASKEEVENNRRFLPPGSQLEPPFHFGEESNHTYYYLVEGGNHSGFGCYGPQKGDGKALISPAEQQDEMITLLTAYFNSLW